MPESAATALLFVGFKFGHLLCAETTSSCFTHLSGLLAAEAEKAGAQSLTGHEAEMLGPTRE